MQIWLAMLIPFIGCGVAFYFFAKKLVIWELLLPLAVCALVIFITKFCVETSLVTDKEYWGAVVYKARYYEYWSTWETKTCQEPCGEDCTTDSNGNQSCSTRYCTVDCSECEEHEEYWEVTDTQGETWRISQQHYNELKARWKAKPVFIDMDRDIDKHGSCGVDGNAYEITWNKDPLTSENSTTTHSYTNKVQASKSHFNLKTISKAEASRYKLYAYPEIHQDYLQDNFLGLESFTCFNPTQKDSAKKMFNFFNGIYGPLRKIRVYVLMFSGRGLDVALKQKDYWDGSNKNEMVICIDADKNTGKLNWVQAFSWTDNKRVAIDLREDIMEMKYLDLDKLYRVVEASTHDFKYKEFADFNYLQVEPPRWAMWLVYILAFLITVGLLIMGCGNDFDNEDVDEDLFKGDFEAINAKLSPFQLRCHVWLSNLKKSIKKIKLPWNKPQKTYNGQGY